MQLLEQAIIFLPIKRPGKMVKMEVQIISREVFKSSSPTIHHKKPYKLCLFDQLTPTTYTPFIFFYPMNEPINPNNIITKTRINQLKKSFSETLDVYFPISGRVIDNLFIDSFNEGVPFLEAQVNCGLSDFLRHHEIEFLNNFLPFQPYTKEDMSAPILAVQVSVFTCGGIAVGISASHKLIDGRSAKTIFSCWASISRGDRINGVIQPDFNESSLFFPPRNSFPQERLSLLENMWFAEGRRITRRFVFDANAIDMLKGKVIAKKPDAKPSRIKTVTCFVWKCCMAASRAISAGSPRPSILVKAVDLRRRTKPPMCYDSIGNNFWWAFALVNPTGTKTELHELVIILDDAIAQYEDSDYTQTLQGGQGFETMSEYLDQLDDIFSIEKPDIFAFTSWSSFEFTKVNFGWGEPYWVGVAGKVGPAFRNLTVLVETKDGKGIEAWITLDEQRMAILERDPEFLGFSSPNPKFSSL